MKIRQLKLLITWWHTISFKAALGAKYPCKSLTLTHCALRELSTRGQPPQRDRQSDEMIMEWRKCVFLLVERESRSFCVGGLDAMVSRMLNVKDEYRR